MKTSSRFMRGALVGTLALGMVPAAAAFADEPSNIVDALVAQQQQRWDAFEASGNAADLVDRNAYNYEDGVSTLGDEDRAALPARFDLREKGVVTPVKLQNPWGTCWGFAAVAASETSILSELGTTYDATKLDLSELQLAWFSQTALPEDDFSQAGEGSYAVNPADRLDVGGMPVTATSIFSSGIGPIPEDAAPYRNAEGITIDDGSGNPLFYSPAGDWSVDESLRFAQYAELEESSILPSPAGIDEDAGGVVYNEDGTLAIKKELMDGRAVQIAFAADDSMPGMPSAQQYMNPETWAHYTYDDNAPINHAVTIVGWDDDYSADNFTEGHRPPANGAWIVKNSWGANNVEFPHFASDDWGIDGSGYFYLSYYDKSLRAAETMDYDVKHLDDENEAYYVNAYDYMPSSGAGMLSSDERISMANVFTAEDDQILRDVSVETMTPGTTATFKVYLLGDDEKDPTGGQHVATVSKTFEYGGYHRVSLNEPVSLAKGQRFSVEVTLRTPSGAYHVLSDSQLNKAGADFINAQEGQQTVESYVKGVINKGESYTIEAGGYSDWKNTTDAIKQATPQGEFIDYDNFPIKAYSDPYEIVVPTVEYDDVEKDDWFYGAVDFVTREGIMSGYGDSRFGPEDSMQRQDIACMFFKWFAPEEAAKYTDPAVVAAVKNETGLPDVLDGAYYTPAVNWCVENGVMKGYEGAAPSFGVGDKVTREQFAKVLYNATGQQGDGLISGDFPDKDKVSSWAVSPLAWATGEGIVTGIDGLLAPQGTATRAQIATMVTRTAAIE